MIGIGKAFPIGIIAGTGKILEFLPNYAIGKVHKLL
jgi:hypothetical protein